MPGYIPDNNLSIAASTLPPVDVKAVIFDCVCMYSCMYVCMYVLCIAASTLLPIDVKAVMFDYVCMYVCVCTEYIYPK